MRHDPNHPGWAVLLAIGVAALILLLIAASFFVSEGGS